MIRSRSSIQPSASGEMARTSGVSMAGWTCISVTPGRSCAISREDALPAAGPPGVVEVVGEQHALLRRQGTEGEAGLPFADRRGQADREPEVHGQVEVDVEELRPQRHGGQVGSEVGDVETPLERPLELRPALAPDLLLVGVLPQVVDAAGEAAVPVDQRRRVGDRPPPVELVLGVEGEVDAEVLAPLLGGGVAGPRPGHHQRGARRRPVPERGEDADVRAHGRCRGRRS